MTVAGIYRSAAGEAQVRRLYAQALARWPVPREQLRLAASRGETFVMMVGHVILGQAQPILRFLGRAR